MSKQKRDQRQDQKLVIMSNVKSCPAWYTVTNQLSQSTRQRMCFDVKYVEN